MPFHLAPQSRREFLRRTSLAAASLLTFRSSLAQPTATDPHRWALLSDTHIAEDPATISRDCNMADRLGRVVDEITRRSALPRGLILNGDCAQTRGLAGDYQTLTRLLLPLRDARLPLHFTLGNHDDRDVFWKSLADHRPAAQLLAARHLSILESERVNWFLLDSLDVTNQTPGLLGEEQRTWLTRALAERAGKPALVMLHHNIAIAEPGKKTGLIDTEELISILQPHRHVKAVFFGHTHVWRHEQRDGLHLVNLPAVGYPFKATEVTGWVDCLLRDDGMSLEIRALDPAHPQHGSVTRLNWRPA